jgi:hypothetical protein
MLVRATLAVAAFLAAILLLWGRSGESEQLFAPIARLPAGPVRPRIPPVALAENVGGDKPKTPRKKGFKAPGWMRQCEYAWDCDSPMQCCEFAGASFCCRGGIGIPAFAPQPQMIPIPVPVPSPSPGYPQGGYPGRYPY